MVTVEPTAPLVRGRRQFPLDAIERQLVAPDAGLVLDGHPLPDLTGAGPVEIAEALVAAMAVAHSDDWTLDDETPVHLCPRCRATVRMAVEVAERIGPTVWPSMVALFDEVLALRDRAPSQ